MTFSNNSIQCFVAFKASGFEGCLIFTTSILYSSFLNMLVYLVTAALRKEVGNMASLVLLYYSSQNQNEWGFLTAKKRNHIGMGIFLKEFLNIISMSLSVTSKRSACLLQPCAVKKFNVWLLNQQYINSSCIGALFIWSNKRKR